MMLTILAVSKQTCLKLDEKPLLLKQLPVELPSTMDYNIAKNQLVFVKTDKIDPN
jgi:hypothetical protein